MSKVSQRKFVVPKKLFRECLCQIPDMVNESFYGIIGEKGTTPPFRSVFKEVKELCLLRYDIIWQYLSDTQRFEMEDIAKDAYYSIR